MCVVHCECAWPFTVPRPILTPRSCHLPTSPPSSSHALFCRELLPGAVLLLLCAQDCTGQKTALPRTAPASTSVFWVLKGVMLLSLPGLNTQQSFALGILTSLFTVPTVKRNFFTYDYNSDINPLYSYRDFHYLAACSIYFKST